MNPDAMTLVAGGLLAFLGGVLCGAWWRRPTSKREMDDWIRRYHRRGGLVLLTLGLGSVAAAHDIPAQVTARTGAVSTLAGDAAVLVLPYADLEVDAPLPVGKYDPARLLARVALTSEPGTRLDLADATTFKAARVTLGAYRVIGRDWVGQQRLELGPTALWSFASKIGQQPADRLTRSYGAGLLLQERTSGAVLTLVYGRDEACGPRGRGQWLVQGRAPLPTKVGQALALVLEASLSVGREQPGQQDVLRVGVVVDLGGLAKVVR